MSFLSQRFDNLSTSENKENRVNKVTSPKILQAHDENVSPVPANKPEVSAHNQKKPLFKKFINIFGTTENCASERK